MSGLCAGLPALLVCSVLFHKGSLHLLLIAMWVINNERVFKISFISHVSVCLNSSCRLIRLLNQFVSYLFSSLINCFKNLLSYLNVLSLCIGAYVVKNNKTQLFIGRFQLILPSASHFFVFTNARRVVQMRKT